MPNPDDINRIYQTLRRLAAENPRAARIQFSEILEGDSHILDAILLRMAAPGEGRLRQLVANAVRTNADRRKLAIHFTNWLAVETDEFARRAIAAAIGEPEPQTRRQPSPHAFSDPHLLEMYRYVADRMRHELCNALLGPKTRILQLRDQIALLSDSARQPELQSLVAQLDDDFQGLGRMVEFEPGDSYFTVRPVVLYDWIESMNSEYARNYRRLDLQIDAPPPARKARVLASDYLLRIIFWNLWLNAHQATGDPCKIRLSVEIADGSIALLVLDNSNGFPPEMAGIVFKEQFSKKAPNRGRGLLEVQDAVQRLHGSTQLLEYRPGEHRVRISFPCEAR